MDTNAWLEIFTACLMMWIGGIFVPGFIIGSIVGRLLDGGWENWWPPNGWSVDLSMWLMFPLWLPIVAPLVAAEYAVERVAARRKRKATPKVA